MKYKLKSDIKGPVILVISDFNIDFVLSSKFENSFSKKLSAEYKL